MRVSVLQENLARALSIVGRVIDSRPTSPVLGNILLMTEDSRLRLSATNLELSVTTYIGAQVTESGGVTLPAKTLSELVNNLSPERVDLTLDAAKQEVNIRCGMANSNVRGIDAGEFPPLPTTTRADLYLPARALKHMILQTIIATAKEDTRPALTGIFVEFKGKQLTLAAADGYRLAMHTLEMESPAPRDMSMLIPAKTMQELARIIGDEEQELGLTLPSERDIVLFSYEDTLIASQLLDGRFPDFQKIIPTAYRTRIIVDRLDLLRNCKRAEIFARDSNHSTRILVRPADDPDAPGEIQIVGRSAERGENESMVDANVEGDVLEAAFNVKYLIEVLNVLDDDQIVVESNGSAFPGVIRGKDRDNYLCVIMPMALSR